MKKFLPYIIVIAVLGVAAIGFAIHKSQGMNAQEEGEFAVDSKSDINKIVLASTDKHVIELTKVNGVWMVNGKFAAREEMTQSLMDAITRVTSLCPVPKAAHDNVLREMLGRNIKVEVFAGKEKDPVKTYYVGGPTVEGDGTYMLQEKNGKTASRPYITYIPNLHGYLTARFNTDEENWRSKVLFNYTEGDIKSVEVEYPSQPQNSFVISRVAPDSFALAAKDAKYESSESYHANYVKQFIGYLSNVSFEAFDNTYPKKDSMLQTIPFCTYTITEKDNSVNKINVYHMPVSERSKAQFDLKGNNMTYDIDHYHASIHNGKDFVIIQYYVFGKLFRSYKDFFFKPGVTPVTKG